MITWLVACFVIGLSSAFLIARFGDRWGLTDRPDGRSSHSLPVPKGGGIGLLIVLAAGAAWGKITWAIWAPAGIVSLISFLGDFRELSYKIRLLVQSLAALFVCHSLQKIVFPGKSPIAIPIILALSALFVTATANYYNFMDGINGIAGVTGIIAFAGLGGYGLIYGKETAAVHFAFGIAAACLGFLPLNFPKARVFMGDVGSVLLGFLFAVWVIRFSSSIIEAIVLGSFLFPFYLDEIGTLIVRLKDGNSLTKAHRRHIYQILVNQGGLPHAKVTIFYGSLQILTIFLVWRAKDGPIPYLIGILAAQTVVWYLVGTKIRTKWERRDARA